MTIDMQMDYYKLTFSSPSELLSQAEMIMQLAPISGWIENDLKEGKEITFYLPHDESGSACLKEISSLISEAGLEIKEEVLRGEDWEETWKKNFITIKIDSIVVTPPWEPYIPKSDEKVIIIEPGMAFGTGDHATTALSIRLIQRYLKKGDGVLDLGTGSGILAMTAALLGSGESVGIDNDGEAVKEALSNISRMNLTDKVTIRQGDVHEEISGNFDMVFANLFIHQVDSILKSKVPFLKKGGIFIGSGITAEQAGEARKSVSENGFEMLDLLQDKLWIAFAARKR